jgi:dUTP pyrophosphatase
MIAVKFLSLDPRAQLPSYQTQGAAGFDFYALEDVCLRAGEVALVRTGLAVEVPSSFELQVRARSGLAAKHGVFLVNGIGTIDSDYRGEVKIILSTISQEPVYLKAGDRIAQGVLAAVVQATLAWTSALSATERAEGGFGSTGGVSVSQV